MVSIIGYENYLITDEGQVWNNDTDKMLKPGLNSKGYYQVVLSKNGKGKSFKIHRLVARHYIINDEGKPTIDHINRDRTDNSVENLRWATHLEQANNKGDFKNNTSGTKNIRYIEDRDRWYYSKAINKVRHNKYFDTEQEAIEYKIEYEKNLV